MYQLLDGKTLSKKIQEDIRNEVSRLQEEGEKTPHLAAVLVGSDPASETYVNNKVKACERVGFRSSLVRMDASISESELLEKVQELNEDDDIDGYIVQLPLPDHISGDKVTENISPEKDVDGFHPMNVGRMVKNLPAFISATPNGIMMLLNHYNIATRWKHCVVVGRSHIVGSPMSILMNTYGDSTVTLCHKYTDNLTDYTSRADILITAVGKPGLITADMVKDDIVVVDVGITRVADVTKKSGYTLKGDVDFEGVAEKSRYITPVPGGVGPMTIASLLQNTLMAAKKAIYPAKEEL